MVGPNVACEQALSGGGGWKLARRLVRMISVNITVFSSNTLKAVVFREKFTARRYITKTADNLKLVVRMHLIEVTQ